MITAIDSLITKFFNKLFVVRKRPKTVGNLIGTTLSIDDQQLDIPSSNLVYNSKETVNEIMSTIAEIKNVRDNIVNVTYISDIHLQAIQERLWLYHDVLFNYVGFNVELLNDYVVNYMYEINGNLKIHNYHRDRRIFSFEPVYTLIRNSDDSIRLFSKYLVEIFQEQIIVPSKVTSSIGSIIQTRVRISSNQSSIYNSFVNSVSSAKFNEILEKIIKMCTVSGVYKMRVPFSNRDTVRPLGDFYGLILLMSVFNSSCFTIDSLNIIREFFDFWLSSVTNQLLRNLPGLTDLIERWLHVDVYNNVDGAFIQQYSYPFTFRIHLDV
jgi:hypothetical protein